MRATVKDGLVSPAVSSPFARFCLEAPGVVAPLALAESQWIMKIDLKMHAQVQVMSLNFEMQFLQIETKSSKSVLHHLSKVLGCWAFQVLLKKTCWQQLQNMEIFKSTRPKTIKNHPRRRSSSGDITDTDTGEILRLSINPWIAIYSGWALNMLNDPSLPSPFWEVRLM